MDCPSYVSRLVRRNPTSVPSQNCPSFPPGRPRGCCRQERRNLAIQVLAGTQPVSDLAREHEVSRKFLYQQAHTAKML